MKKTKKEKLLLKIQLLEEALEKSKAETRKAKKKYKKAKRKKEAIIEVLAKKRTALIPKPKPETAPKETKKDFGNPGNSGLPTLRLIKGIGPKIEKLLYEAGINSFEMLVSFTPEQLTQILSEAGPKFRHYDPTSWLNQAQKLAREVNKKEEEPSDLPSKPSEKEKK